MIYAAIHPSLGNQAGYHAKYMLQPNHKTSIHNAIVTVQTLHNSNVTSRLKARLVMTAPVES